MEQGGAQPAPGISGPAAGGAAAQNMHTYEWTLLSQSINGISLALARM